MIAFTDMHCHILPGLDDGPRTMEETLEILRKAKQQNVARMIVTPHYHPCSYPVHAQEITAVLSAVRKEAERNGIGIRLYPGQECYYYSELISQLHRGEVLTLAGSRYVLVEFSPDCGFSGMSLGLQELQENGFHPILAHFERYECLRDPTRLDQLKKRGILLQMNLSPLLERDHWFRKDPLKAYVIEGKVDYLGSDCHGTSNRRLQADKGMEWIQKHVPPQLQRRMLWSNIRKILTDTA